MSKAHTQFENGIKDAEELLDLFNANNKTSPSPNAEVLKRAGLVMVLTAWETYVEDIVVEQMDKKLAAVRGSYAGDFIKKRLDQELKGFHNPSSDKTRHLFKEYLDIDIQQAWIWANMDCEKAKQTLNELIGKRGDAVHRSKPLTNGITTPHLIRKDELEKAIRFVKELVKSTDKYIECNQ